MRVLPRLLIAEGDSELCSALAEIFSQDYLVKTCRDGCQARSLLQNFHPDLLLLDLMLPNTDGITLLREIPEEERPVTIAVALFTSPYIQTALQQLQVSYMFLKPLNIAAVADRVQEMAAAILPSEPVFPDASDMLFYLLQDMGLAPKADGFAYLLEAIPLYRQDPQQALTKELYPAVGSKFNKSATCVERSIRTAIEGAWRRSGYRNWDRLFSALPDGTVVKPSNCTFISAVATCLAQREKESFQVV